MSFSDPGLLQLLQEAAQKSDVRQLIERYGVNQVNQAWKQLDPVHRASLQFCRAFDGVLVQRLSDTPEGSSSDRAPSDPHGDHFGAHASSGDEAIATEAAGAALGVEPPNRRLHLQWQQLPLVPD